MNNNYSKVAGRLRTSWRNKLRTLACVLFAAMSLSASAQAGINDLTFNPNDAGGSYGDGGGFGVLGGYLDKTVLLPNGKILLLGDEGFYNGLQSRALYRINSDGSIDPSFHFQGAGSEIVDAAVQPDGKIIIVGGFVQVNGASAKYIARLNDDGTTDTSFHTGTGLNGSYPQVLLQPDGKILVCGAALSDYNGTYVPGLFRMNTDGSIDSTYLHNLPPTLTQDAFSMLLLSSGKLLVSGRVRLNPDGTKDSSYNYQGTVNGRAWSMVEQPDHKILMSGEFQTWNGVPIPNIIRVDSTGALDNTFQIGHCNITVGNSLALQPDGKVIAAGWIDSVGNKAVNGVVRLNTDGSRDPSFDAGKAVGNRISIEQVYPRSVSLLTNGQMLLAGFWHTFDGTARKNLVKLNADGSIDPLFNRMGSASGTIKKIIAQADGKLIMGGLFDGYQNFSIHDIVRTDANGVVDTTFKAGTVLPLDVFVGGVLSIAQQADGKILVGGGFDDFGNTGVSKIGRFNTDGSVDTSFRGGTGANDRVLSVTTDAAGKILIGGSFTSVNGISFNKMSRLNANGTVDTSFHIGTGFSIGGEVDVIKVLPNGKILVGGSFTTFNGSPASRIIRLNNDGSADTTFNVTDGLLTVYDLDIQSDGKIVAGGSDYRPLGIVRRYNTNGTTDSSFSFSILNGTIYTLNVLIDGKIFIAGDYNYFATRENMAMLYPSGSFERISVRSSGLNDPIFSSIIQNDHIIIGGRFTNVNGTGRNRVSRLISFCQMPPSPTGAVADTICGGNRATLHIGAGLGTIGWYTGPVGTTPFAAGGLTFTTGVLQTTTTFWVQDSTCDHSWIRTPVTAVVKPTPTISITPSVDTICTGSAAVIYSTRSAGSTVSWSTGSSADSIVVSPVVPTIYRATATNSIGCTAADSFRLELYPTAVPVVTVTELPPFINVAAGGIASANDYYGVNPPADAFDGDTTTTGWANNSNGFPSWLAYDLGAGNSKVVRAYTFYNSQDMQGGWSNPNYNPVSWTFEGSNDSITWTVLDTVANGNITIGEVKFFASTNTNPYRRYRFNFTYTVDGDYVRLTEAQLLVPDSQFCRDRNYVASGSNFSAINTYQWKLKGVNVGNNSRYLTLPKVRYGDSISCTISGASYCTLPTSASGYIKVTSAPNNTTIVNAGTITSNELGANYQWIKCGPVKRDIPGKTNVSYTPDSSGDYAVIVLKAGCVDTSLCISFTKPTGINDMNEEAIAFTIYPNPNNGSFMLTSSVAGEYSLINELGQKVQSLRLEANVPYHLTNEALSSGIYYLIANDQQHMVRNKVVVVK